MKKKCSKCEVNKDLKDYSDKKGGILGKDSLCKICKNKASIRYKRTKRGLLLKIYSSQCTSSRKRGILLPEYSKEDFVEKFINDAVFVDLYDQWKKKEYSRWFTPSFDRGCDYSRYSFENINIMTWKENSEKASRQRRSGYSTPGERNIPVRQLDMDNNIINEFVSLNEAGRETKLNTGNIWQVIKGRKKTTGGFKWERI